MSKAATIPGTVPPAGDGAQHGEGAVPRHRPPYAHSFQLSADAEFENIQPDIIEFYNRGNCTATNFLDCVDSADREVIARLLDEVRGDGEQRSFECRISCSGEISRYIEGVLNAVPDAPGCVSVWAYDVSRHRRDAHHFEQIVEGALQGIVVHRGGKFLYVNDTVAQMVGLEGSIALMGHETIGQFIHPDDREIVAANIQARVEGREDAPLDYEFRLIDLDGNAIWVDCRATILDWEGEPTVLAALFDITDKKLAQEAQRHSEELFARVFQTTPDMIILSRLADGTIVDVNQSFLNVYGLDIEEVIGKTGADLGIWQDMEDREKFLNEIAAHDVLEDMEIRSVNKAGQEFRFNLTGAKLEFRGEELMLIFARDITDRYRQRMELRGSKDAAELANRTKSEFLANMSHELRTPLNAILGFSEAIRDEMFGGIEERRYVEYADDIHTSGGHLLDIINDILDLSKIEAGKLELEIDRVSVAETFGQCLRIVNERAVYAGIMIRVEQPADTDISVGADQRRLKQVFINLLSNAIKFTEEGGEIILGCRLTDAGGCEMYVNDTGIGMSEAEVKKALMAFGQVDSSFARKEEGAGLGLPLVVAFVEMMGGTLTVESEKGRGTAITIHVPPELTIIE